MESASLHFAPPFGLSVKDHPSDSDTIAYHAHYSNGIAEDEDGHHNSHGSLGIAKHLQQRRTYGS